MSAYEIVQYTDATGSAPFERWLSRQESGVAAKIYAVLMRMEAGNLADSKLLKGGIWERRIHSGPGYRVYYALHDRRFVVVLGGGTKQSQSSDIRKARRAWYEFQTR